MDFKIIQYNFECSSEDTQTYFKYTYPYIHMTLHFILNLPITSDCTKGITSVCKLELFSL